MIVYQKAYDLYHTVYRMIKLLAYFKQDGLIEIDRLRIWDYYLLYPNKMKNIRLKREEKDVKQIIKSYILKEDNPYEMVINDRKMFEKIKPYQMTAIKCLASYGIVNKDYLQENRISNINKNIFDDYADDFKNLSVQEENAIKLLTSHFYQISLFGVDGLKSRTGLLESKYDA
ncbi:ABC-three component system middle component 5 [uncultured Polaribacter sp.]|uniref:ABC-three component system middle component 5 n=1 Tax=uncultured Polaribacter sp. TaxID=174711 RepID=UPI00261DEFFD|nr:ABC-three component system middle component 5 [uncultured Polaribacter sp.]